MNTFLQIIKAADLASTTEPSSLASPHSPYSASPALSTTVDSSTQDNQVKKKQILKRVNIQDIQDMKVCKFLFISCFDFFVYLFKIIFIQFVF